MGQASHKHHKSSSSTLANPANASKHSSTASSNSNISSTTDGSSSCNNNKKQNSSNVTNNNSKSGNLLMKHKKKKKQAKAVMVGLDHAGKTSIMMKLKHGNKGKNLPSTVPTLGFNVEVLKYKRTVLTMFDIGGLFFKTKQLAQHYFEKNQAVIIVVDSSDRDRFEEVREMIHVVTENPLLSDCKILLYFNKQDIEGACSVQEFKKECLGIIDSSLSSSSLSSSSPCSSTTSTSLSLAASSSHRKDTLGSSWTSACIKQPFTIQPCSAKTGEGLFEGLDWLTQNV
ncbi:hypothetical protein FDP41_009205 [Naegleria fowleri]|uniref:ADP-ribosylation factor-like protein 6 n=1 Tax=Naegleria fowleri TaxID=5763 RepID=A0A6A5BBG7_NAEFO|nr:uncharacterized protein FDP41_009205 [Naegleria fowleri]KAF0972302.1 hypothetical protein FDP41_009205 [Naegleria fowleri]